MKKIVTIAAALLCIIGAQAQEWRSAWDNPREEHRPWTFWYWMYGCVSDDGIRADLQAMKDAGIAGFYLMPIKGVADGKATAEQLSLMGAPDYFTAEQLSDGWWQRFDTVLHTADSLGLKMGIHFSDGFALGGGPWITPDESMQRIVWSDTVVDITSTALPLSVDELPLPPAKEGYYEDIAVYAWPATYYDDRQPTCNLSFPVRASEPTDIIMTYDEPFTLRSVKVITGGNNYQAHRLTVYAMAADSSWVFVRQITPARQGWQNTDAQATYSIPATTATQFRFHWTPEGSDPGSEDMDAAKWKPNLRLADLRLSSEPVIDGYEGKSGAVWRVSQAFPTDSSCCIPLESILCGTMQDQAVPGGTRPGSTSRWHILRMGHTSTGHTNATGGGGKGLECDKFSRSAIRKQFDGWFGEIYKHACEQQAGGGRSAVLTRLHLDSWECGSQNWGYDFAGEFKARRGYDLMPWLPVYAGVPIGTDYERVLRDIRLTIAELIDEVFFDEFETLGRQYGCEISEECVAPTMVSDGLLHYRHADYPMGEFWLNSPTHDKPNDMLDAVSGAHIYGKNIIQAEGFTEVRGTWDEHPAMLKPLLDRNYCLGINSIVFHVNTHNPFTNLRPGMTLDGIGTFFQRDNTWWREMPAFIQYISRCQALLQYGDPVVDIAVYTGDEVPRRAILPERLTTTLPGLLGEQTLSRERERLLNEGQPLEVSPVGVTHTKNMTKAEQWINPLRGYRYDSFNHDVLDKSHVETNNLELRTESCGANNIVTSGGMHYKVLVLPQARPMNPDRLMTCDSTINALRALGATVIDEPWTADDLSTLGIERDADLPEGVDYTHRHGAEADIYFVSNQTDSTVTFVPAFRDTRTYAYVADPMNGTVSPMGSSLTLLPAQSLFIVYSDAETPADGRTETVTALTDITGRWTMTFETTGRTLTTDTLFDWSTHTDANIRYYSGHVAYEMSFKAKNPHGGRLLLDLGDVHDIATVYVNGQCCGTAWTAPYVVDITDAVTKGSNKLRIEVVNTWANALLGNDLGTPPFTGIWTNGKYRRAEKTTLPAGLLGPLKMIRQQ